MNKPALIIFMKNPVKGKVKTRLARSVGDDAALSIYLKLLDHHRQVTRHFDAIKYLFYSESIEPEDEWEGNYFDKRLQQGNDLGERMLHAFKTVFREGAEKAVIIGTDCYEMEPAVLRAAFDALDHSDIVLGPAFDGGYYLLGMKQLYHDFFIGKTWGSSAVLNDTLNNIDLLKLRLFQLEQLHDIDIAEDLALAPAHYQIEITSTGDDDI